ncbi:hypothetical protein [Pseudolysobacter antarcticus]|uniref:hypothetical protein n=1 Tax=Pseudolysobacter antarcticus TaxID=2511995 RepID=UPI001A92FE40|nr:hypothetical protein [Pseudolysobacter antarcticus]
MNTLLSLFTVWLVLLDHCLIVATEMPLSNEVAILMLIRASMIAFVALLVNGALPLAAEMLSDDPKNRMEFIALAIPSILFLISPIMISDSLYRARYGNLNKSVVQAHVWKDFGVCCLNPFSRPVSPIDLRR